jgi:16S rRNA (uracil1498-N3)-methyltransferase
MRVFDGFGQEWLATVTEMGRKHVEVVFGHRVAPSAAELPVEVTLAVGMPANDRMDGLIEKATELGVSAIQPLVCERTVLRLDGERAAKKVAHWQAVAIAACEQSGRAKVPAVHGVRTLSSWLNTVTATAQGVHAGVLSLQQAMPLSRWLTQSQQIPPTPGAPAARFVFLSGPEGGLTEAEEGAARAAGWTPLTLGPRVLRADTAPLAALSVMAAYCEG